METKTQHVRNMNMQITNFGLDQSFSILLHGKEDIEEQAKLLSAAQ